MAFPYTAREGVTVRWELSSGSANSKSVTCPGPSCLCYLLPLLPGHWALKKALQSQGEAKPTCQGPSKEDWQELHLQSLGLLVTK